MPLVATTLILASLAAGPTHKCKGKDGKWTEAACTGAAAPPPANIERSDPSTPSSRHAASSTTDGGPSPMGDSDSDIGAYCADLWKKDFRMQKACIVEQGNAAERMNNTIASIRGNRDLQQIVVDCSQKWTNPYGFDFTMVENCWKVRKAAYDREDLR